ncbi:ENR1 protein, partial [Lophotis ruficrista]|nr:ENR1 protein [Lophotis ruficrista]
TDQGLFSGSGNNPFQGIAGLSKFWKSPGETARNWTAPDGLYWIYGKRAYFNLPPDWGGTCTIGLIPAWFFLFPSRAADKSGVPVF